MHLILKKTLGKCLFLFLFPCLVFAGDVIPDTKLDVEVSEALVSGSGKTESIGVGKSDTGSLLLKKYKEIEKHADEVERQITVSEGERRILEALSGIKKLKEMERRALLYGNMKSLVQERDAVIQGLKQDLNRFKELAEAREERIAELVSATNRLHSTVRELEEKKAELEKALNVIKLGDYEHYEVREGDTCRSIAAKPMIYGDEKKHLIIRQANAGHVEDLDNLEAGQMLIIPRFNIERAYEF